MIHSARPTVSPVATLLSLQICFILKSGRMDGRTTCTITMILTGGDFGVGRVDQKVKETRAAFFVTVKEGREDDMSNLKKNLVIRQAPYSVVR